jgi:PilZ domain
MDQTFLIQSMIIGGALFLGLILFWFIHVYLRKHVAPKHTVSRLPSASWDDRRQHQRMAVSWPASMETSDGTIRVTLQNISLGGAFVVCQNPLPLKHQFNLGIDPPDFAALHLKAEVVWSNINVPDDRVVNRGMGVRFVDNPEAESGKLRQIIAAIKNQTLR